MKPYNGNKPYIFISYAHKNITRVISIVERMNIDGYRMWYDEGIDPGNEWADNIATKIRNSTCLIAMISKDYLQSENCKDEISYARENGVKIVLLYIEDVQLSGGLALRNHRMQSLFQFKYLDQNEFYKKLYDTTIIKKCRQIDDLEEKLATEADNNKKIIDVQLLHEMSGNGNVEAIYKLANLYERGEYLLEDKKRAFELYTLASESGYEEAFYDLSRCYKYGLGVEKDKEKGMQLLVKAANLGNAKALEWLAFSYEHGEGVKKNIHEAIKLYISAYEKGNHEAASALGRIYYYGEKGTIKKDRAQAAYWFKLSVEAGELVDANYLGAMYLNGDGVIQDDEEAAKWYKIGADEDFMGDGQYELGMMYLQGYGVEQDKEEGIKWLVKATEEEIVPNASAELGRIYEEGDGAEIDIEKSKEWYEKAADTTFAFLRPKVLLKTQKGRRKIVKYVVELLASIIYIGVFVYAGNKGEQFILGTKEPIKVGIGIFIISLISGFFMQRTKKEIFNDIGNIFFALSLIALNSVLIISTTSYSIYFAILIGIFVIGVCLIKKVKKLDFLGGMLIVMFIGAIIGVILFGIKNTYNIVTNEVKENDSQGTESIEFGALIYKVPSNWKFEIGNDEQSITYYPYAKSGWPFIYIYKTKHRLDANRGK